METGLLNTCLLRWVGLRIAILPKTFHYQPPLEYEGAALLRYSWIGRTPLAVTQAHPHRGRSG